jgi:hypothetical protein
MNQTVLQAAGDCTIRCMEHPWEEPFLFFVIAEKTHQEFGILGG